LLQKAAGLGNADAVFGEGSCHEHINSELPDTSKKSANLLLIEKFYLEFVTWI
jgi:hypothetical protein